MLRIYAEELAKPEFADRPPDLLTTGKPAWAFLAISDQYGDSPEAQALSVCRYAIRWGFRIVGVHTERQSRSMRARKPRRKFMKFWDAYIGGDLVDEACCRVYTILVKNRDRITRNPEEQVQMTRAIRDHWDELAPGAANIIECDSELRAPSPLTLSELNRWITETVEDADEVEQLRRRGMEKIWPMSEQDGYPHGKTAGFCHRPSFTVERSGRRKIERLWLFEETEPIGLELLLRFLFEQASYADLASWAREQGATTLAGGSITAESVRAFVRSPMLAGGNLFRRDEMFSLTDAGFRGEFSPTWLKVARGQEEIDAFRLLPREEQRALLRSERVAGAGVRNRIDQLVPWWFWDLCQAEADRRAGLQAGVVRGRSSLAGLVRCWCGRPMVIQSRDRQGRRVLTCLSYKERQLGRQTRARGARIEPEAKHASILYELVLESARRVCLSADQAAEQELAAELAALAPAEAAAQARALEQQIADARAEADRIGALAAEGILSKEAARKQQAPYRQQAEQAAAALARLAAERHRQQRLLVPPGLTVEQAWDDADEAWRGRLLATVIETITVSCINGSRRKGYRRLAWQLAEGWQLADPNQLTAICATVWRDANAGRAWRAYGAEVRAKLIELHDQGLSPKQIADWLNTDTSGRYRPLRAERWERGTVQDALRRALAHAGRIYTPHRRRDRPSESLETLMRARFAAGHSDRDVAEQLNELNLTTPNGHAFTETNVRRYRRRLLGSQPDRRRRRSLPPELETAALRLYENENRSLQWIAAWLTAEGWPPRSRSGRWSRGTVWSIILRARAERDSGSAAA